MIISEIDNKYLGNLITGLSIRDIMYPIACYLLLGILISYMKEKRIFDPPAKQMKKNYFQYTQILELDQEKNWQKKEIKLQQLMVTGELIKVILLSISFLHGWEQLDYLNMKVLQALLMIF